MDPIDLTRLNATFMDRNVRPTLLFQDGKYAIYWIGVPEDSAFRNNSYLITDGTEALLIDPGGHNDFPVINQQIKQIISSMPVTAMVFCHQDPDAAGSMADWLALNPGMNVITAAVTNLILPHFGRSDYSFFNINEEPFFSFGSGHKLRFFEAPFLHSPGAFVTYDETSGFLFSGDIWAAIDMDWRLVVENFPAHVLKMNLYHINHMASNIAARGFVGRIRNLLLKAILPQHGSIIPEKFIPQAMDYLLRLKCGLDLVYPDIKQK
ncbi:MAG: MBL fold metallo-hydrolase [Bacteroidales bacterium]|nr:MBL fold metallo-hydrolase [Bacteroidales bacterium]